MVCISVLDEVDKEQSFTCLRWSRTDDADYSDVIREELNTRVDLNMVQWLQAEPFSAIFAVVHNAKGNPGITSLCIAIP